MTDNNTAPYDFRFLCIPLALMEDARYRGLSPTAILIYSLLLARTGLSVSNGWADDEGRTYVYYSNEALRRRLSCSHDRVTKAMRELEAKDLLIRVRQHLTRPDRLYVLPIPECC